MLFAISVYKWLTKASNNPKITCQFRHKTTREIVNLPPTFQ
ncbi:Uncharacterised protein [Vibrio cholerae]|nr:Uncharacterised protein [Vibrio cholerae]